MIRKDNSRIISQESQFMNWLYKKILSKKNTMKLEFPEKKHEIEYLEMMQEFSNNKEKAVPSSAILKKDEKYDDFLQRIKNEKEWVHLKPWYVKQELYFLIDNNNKIVWAEAIRPELNETLKFHGGHIGYGIRPSERRKGYAKEGLRLVLEKCKDMWIDKVLVTCNKDNIGSAKTIIRNWWKLDSEYEYEGEINQRYRIPIK